MSEAVIEQVNYIVHPTYVESIDPDGSEYEWRDDATLYGDLVLAGYPINNDTCLGGYYIDLAVRGRQVIVFTSNPAVEHDMGDVAGLFLSWQVLNDPSNVA